MMVNMEWSGKLVYAGMGRDGLFLELSLEQTDNDSSFDKRKETSGTYNLVGRQTGSGIMCVKPNKNPTQTYIKLLTSHFKVVPTTKCLVSNDHAHNRRPPPRNPSTFSRLRRSQTPLEEENCNKNKKVCFSAYAIVCVAFIS